MTNENLDMDQVFDSVLEEQAIALDGSESLEELFSLFDAFVAERSYLSDDEDIAIAQSAKLHLKVAQTKAGKLAKDALERYPLL